MTPSHSKESKQHDECQLNEQACPVQACFFYFRQHSGASVFHVSVLSCTHRGTYQAQPSYGTRRKQTSPSRKNARTKQRNKVFRIHSLQRLLHQRNTNGRQHRYDCEVRFGSEQQCQSTRQRVCMPTSRTLTKSPIELGSTPCMCIERRGSQHHALACLHRPDKTRIRSGFVARRPEDLQPCSTWTHRTY